MIVAERKRRLDGIDQIVLSLSAKGVTTGEIAAYFDEVYGPKVSKNTISRVMEKVTGELAKWFFRPLDVACPVVFVDVIVGVGPLRAGPQHPGSMSSWASRRMRDATSWASGLVMAQRARGSGLEGSPS